MAHPCMRGKMLIRDLTRITATAIAIDPQIIGSCKSCGKFQGVMNYTMKTIIVRYSSIVTLLDTLGSENLIIIQHGNVLMIITVHHP